MAQRPQRPCAKTGCNNLTRKIYCDSHQDLAEEEKRKRAARLDKRRQSAQQRGYTYKWSKARTAYLQTNPLCVHCLRDGIHTRADVVDHIKPHKGDQRLFWSRSNWQSLCKRHHDIKTATEDGGFGRKNTQGGAVN